jgi:hypothetical protein
MRGAKRAEDVLARLCDDESLSLCFWQEVQAHELGHAELDCLACFRIGVQFNLRLFHAICKSDAELPTRFFSAKVSGAKATTD